MTFTIDSKLSWTDHYVEHGFAVIKGAVGPGFIEPALAEVCELMGNNLPPDQWTIANTAQRSPRPVNELRFLPQIYDQPCIKNIFEGMFGSASQWDGQRLFQLFVSPFSPDAKAEISPMGHIDFVDAPVPIFGSGFMFQVSLVQSEPFSGNITIYPGSHKLVQRALAEDPERRYPADLQQYLECEPFEFVAEPGDVLLFHHLVGHAGNANHAAGRSPRVVLHCQGNRKTWMRELNPKKPGLTPWERSLAFIGRPYRTRFDELEWITDFRKQRQKQPAAV
jgi:hypothetical protein